MSKYVVIAGAIPALKHERRHIPHTKGKKRQVRMGDVLEEDYFEDGEANTLLKGGFIEKFEPHKLTKEDLAVTHEVKNPISGAVETKPANKAIVDALGLKVGDTIHKGTKGFRPAPTKETKATKPSEEETEKI